MIAAHACRTNDVECEIFSRDAAKSQIHGSQYLHEPVPGLIRQDSGRPVQYINYGTPEEYRRKTHGKYWDGTINPGDFIQHHTAYNIRDAYNLLWLLYGGLVKPFELIGYQHLSAQIELRNYSMIISTVPRTIWKLNGDQFIYSRGWAINGPVADSLTAHMGENTIICDGRPGIRYNRKSKVFGHSTIEWPDIPEFPLPKGHKPARIIKPLRHMCTHKSGTAITVALGADRPMDYEPPWIFTGRYGKWQKGIVTTDVWHEVNDALKEFVL